MKFKAFTMLETITVLVIIGLFAAILLPTLRPTQTREQALVEGGKAMYVRLDSTTRDIISRKTTNFTLGAINDATGQFSIASSSNQTRLINFYKKYFKPSRSITVSNNYKSTILIAKDGSKPAGNISPSTFGGYVLKNGSYLGFKLHGNCSTNETFLFNPYLPNQRTQSNSCGRIYFDVNGDNGPNYLGVDQFIVSLKLVGVR